jgi:hypothetical protein
MGGLVDSISTYKSAFYICHPKQQPLKTYFMMKMRKTMWAVCLAALMPVSAEAVAATSYDEPQQKENTQKKEITNPEKTARRRTDEMDKVLNLTEKQYKKLYKLNLKEEREKLEVLIGRGGKDMNRPPMREGGRPPMMNGGGQPPMMTPPAGDDKMKEEMQERAEKKIKKLRKILTDEQYDLWLTMKPEQPVPHPMPEAGRPAPHEEDFPVEMLQNETEHE